MGKKKKLKLTKLRVKSFLTQLEGDEQDKVMGGTPVPSWPPLCPSGDPNCPTDPGECPSYDGNECDTGYQVCFTLVIPCSRFC